MSLLEERVQTWRREEREALRVLREVLIQLKADEQDRKALDDSLAQLDDLFLLVVVGEFNAGKSALINALLGEALLPEGVTPTTTQVQVLRYGPEPQVRPLAPELMEQLLPADILQDLSIVDTPGTNAVIREHEILTSNFIPRADLVIFVTSADRPFTESERTFMDQIKNWGKKLVLVVNKIDLLETPEDRETVRSFVAENAKRLLGLEPPIFLVSAKQALQAKVDGHDVTRLETSGFAAFEAYLKETLDQKERLRLKFLNPLGVGMRLVRQYKALLLERKTWLDRDMDTIRRLDDLLEVYRQDMERGFELRMMEMDHLLLELESRAHAFFDETIRLGRIFDLVNKKRVQEEFKTKVIQDIPQLLEERVESLIDWLVEAELRQWEALLDAVAQHRPGPEDVPQSLQAPFFARRETLVGQLKRKAQAILASYDKEQEAQRLAQGLQHAVAATAALQVGAVGLGALLTAVATTLAADVTGVIAASALAALGLFIIPARRRRASAEVREKVKALRQNLSRTLYQQFHHEIQRSIEAFQNALSPFTRFVRAEHQRVMQLLDQLEDVEETLKRLKAEVEAF